MNINYRGGALTSNLAEKSMTPQPYG